MQKLLLFATCNIKMWNKYYSILCAKICCLVYEINSMCKKNTMWTIKYYHILYAKYLLFGNIKNVYFNEVCDLKFLLSSMFCGHI